MTVDRQKVLDAFAAYINPYDAQDPKVSLKIHHTYRVAALCEQIGRSIALEGTALDLAWLCGMLHDVGRFEQLRRFGTFDDSKSIDHARAGVQVLLSRGISGITWTMIPRMPCCVPPWNGTAPTVCRTAWTSAP